MLDTSFGLSGGEYENADAQPYKYNGKEFIEMHGYDVYDYGGRHYYLAHGRWKTMDPWLRNIILFHRMLIA
nr:hypothetical protein [uncultured Bacteroides sp.]